MVGLLLLPVFVSVCSAVGLFPKTSINNDLDQIKCPSEDDPRFQLILPHPSDCSKYFLCNNGDAYLQACPMGLHFTYEHQRCSYPEEVGCNAGREKLLKQKLRRESGVEECPSEDGSKPTYLPHPSDCGKFFICHAGKAHLKSCLPGLHFNRKIQVCDYPNRAGCEKTLAPRSRDQIIEEELLGCLMDKSGQRHLIPNPHNCSKYVVCENGRTFIEDCPNGLHFNVYKKSCDNPENAKCEFTKPIVSVRKAPGVPSPFCPTVDRKEQIFFLHPSNCSEYYMCDHGLAYKFGCPARLHFNLKKKACDYEWLAECETGEN